MEITLNGETRRIEAPLSVRRLLEQLGLDPAKIAVERNLEIVPRSTYDQVAVGEGDRLEIVHFIGGGNAPVEVPSPADAKQTPNQTKVDKPFVLAVTPGKCSDGMSDRSYPFTVTLMVMGEQREGCAWTDKQPFSGPQHP